MSLLPGDSSGVRAVGATLFDTRDRPAISRSLLPALLAFLIGACVSLGAFFVLKTRHVERQRRAFEDRATEVTGALQLGLDLPVEVLRSIPSLFEASIDVSRREFRSFTAQALGRHPGIYALEWLPLVPGELREDFEAAARADGLEGFHFKEDRGGGEMVPADSRSFYMPIYYMEPPNEIALGFDIASEKARFAPAEQAAMSGSTVASPRIRLVEDAPNVYSIAVFHPVYLGEPLDAAEDRLEALRGVAAEVFRVAPMVERALRTVDLTGLDLILLDESAPPDTRLLYETLPGLYSELAQSDGLRTATRFPFADRRWSMVAVAEPAYVGEAATAWSVLTVGLLMSALLAVGIGASSTITRLRRQMRAALKLGQYTLVERIGGGGMGVVYRARHAMLRRPTAIKLLPPGTAGEERLARFEREVQMTSRLRHPNTIAIYDYGRTDTGVLYYVMEYIDGVSFAELVEKFGALPAARVIHLLQQACGSLAEAHKAGLIHRDVKPANLMLCVQGGIYDFVKVLDFGLVKELETGESDLSRPGMVMGTPLYMSPEAIRSPESVDASSDIYALGAVAYTLITGSPVFPGDNVIDVCRGHLYEEATPPSQRSELEIPDELEALILRCLEKDPDRRPVSAAALLEALEGIEAALPVAWTQEEARRWWLLHEPARAGAAPHPTMQGSPEV